MPTMGYPLDAFLLVDNNAIVNLCEFYCDAHKHKPFTKMVQAVCQDLSAVFATLRRFALDNTIFTTDCVQAEFMPESGIISGFSGFTQKDCERLKTHISREVEAVPVNMNGVGRLRSMQEKPRKLGEGLNRLSNPDLSLVILVLGIAKKFNRRVYILTDDEDLRYFVSWMKTRPEAEAMCTCPQHIDALHSLIYMDSAHRSCAFSSEQIYQLLTYLSMSQLRRSMLFGTTKGEMITQTFQSLYEAINASSAEKRKYAQGGMAA